MRKKRFYFPIIWMIVLAVGFGFLFNDYIYSMEPDQVKERLVKRAQAEKKKGVVVKAPRPPVLRKVYSDPDEAAIPNSKDFRQIILRIMGGYLYTDIIFYSSMNLSEFFYYFSTDADAAAEICVRCKRNEFEVAKETKPGWYNTVIYRGTPNVSGSRYSLRLPWSRIFGRLETIKLWLFSMDGRDRLPDSGHITLSWWSLVRCSRSEQTLYQGIVYYKHTPQGWWMRCGGTVDNRSDSFFPQINIRNQNVLTLLSAVGCPTNLTWNDTVIWQRVVKVWKWLQSNQLSPGSANYNAAKAYISGLGHWPALFEIAHVYVTYGGIFWGTCMSRAQLFATLLYAVGVPPDKFTIAEAYWKPAYSQHMYVIIYLNNHWYYLDPTYISQNLSITNVASVGSGSADYIHPLKIMLLPGSKLPGVPLVK